ncbi:ABC transporter permease [Aestuariibacter halophilus]|uniref:ABC transporter permease n=1 Tax=Fluctibacter halophilus TaxID=226011 RepID=A0ABS8G6B9_9ALTE|nr:ABC transporter permease [Aestuariibacter halophilus]MCC2616132.1 ABC transporter permease [Aestuariibacter halophilus]
MTAMYMDTLFTAVRSINAYALRSLLSSLGIAVSVGAMIAVVSVIQGFSSKVSGQFEGFGANSLTIQPVFDYQAQLRGKYATLRASDLDIIRDNVQGIDAITPEITVVGRYSAQAGYQGKVINTDVRGTTATWKELFLRYPDKGRFITTADDAYRRKVAVVGHQVVKDLALPDDPTGEYLQIENEWFRIIGVLDKRGKNLGMNQDDLILIPFNTAISLTEFEISPSFWFQMQVLDMEKMQAVQQRIRMLLRKNHGLKKGEEDDFEILTADQFMDSFKSITQTITIVLGGIVSISMIVGGIGIMNTMIMSVTERTREIGIAKALGAPRKMLLLQFLLEAVILSLYGGVTGIALGYVLSELIAFFAQFPSPVIPVWIVLFSMGFSVVIGVLFGFTPAFKAANLEPIDALKFQS